MYVFESLFPVRNLTDSDSLLYGGCSKSLWKSVNFEFTHEVLADGVHFEHPQNNRCQRINGTVGSRCKRSENLHEHNGSTVRTPTIADLNTAGSQQNAVGVL